MGADVTPAADAVITSVAAQPLSRYDPIAVPFTVATPVLKTALPMLAHVEEKVTFWGVVTAMGGVPLDTVTVMLVVPKAESAAAPTPRTGAVTVTVAVPTVNPTEPFTASVPTWAVALTAVAPALEIVAVLRVAVATPDASVKAVAVGVMVASVPSVLKVTIAFGITAPAAFFRVAFSVAGAPFEIDVTVAPAELVSASVKVGAVVVTVVPVVVPVVSVVVPPLVSSGEAIDPLPQPARTAKVAAQKSEAESLEIPWPKKIRAAKKTFCT